MCETFLSDDFLWEKKSPTQEQEFEEEEELTELQMEVAENRRLKSKIKKANEKLSVLLDCFPEYQSLYKNKIQEIINDLK